MEWFLSLFILHDTLVVSLLVVGITIVVVMLLLFTQKSPENVVKSELGGNENVESALRRVLGEQRWAQAGASNATTGDAQEVDALQMEVLEKDRKIAELNKKLTQEGPRGEAGSGGDDSELLAKLAEMEARLLEYEIIEDDIADLSLYKTENEKLKDEIEALKAKIGQGGTSPEPASEPTPEPTPEPELKVVESVEEETPEPVIDEPEESGGVDGADLVAEFEKVVNSQSQITPPDEDSSKTSVEQSKDPGKVVMAEELAGKKEVVEEKIPVHPKLKDINPDSKEEAEVFISELKSFKAIQKKTGGDS